MATLPDVIGRIRTIVIIAASSFGVAFAGAAQAQVGCKDGIQAVAQTVTDYQGTWNVAEWYWGVKLFGASVKAGYEEYVIEIEQNGNTLAVSLQSTPFDLAVLDKQSLRTRSTRSIEGKGLAKIVIEFDDSGLALTGTIAYQQKKPQRQISGTLSNADRLGKRDAGVIKALEIAFECIERLESDNDALQAQIAQLLLRHEVTVRELNQEIYSFELQRDALRDDVAALENRLAERQQGPAAGGTEDDKTKIRKLTEQFVQATLLNVRLDAQKAEVQRKVELLQASMFERGQRLWDDGIYLHACQVFSSLAETNPTNPDYVARTRDC